MSSRFIVHGLPGSDQFRNHPDSVATRIRRCSFTPSSPLAIGGCPLDPCWRDWDMFGEDYNFARLSEADFDVCAAARRTRPVRRWYRVPLFWERGGGDGPAPVRPVSSSKRAPRAPSEGMHMHAEALMDRHLVHVDYVSLVKHSPGRSLEEIRVFVDGRLAGRGGRCGTSLGGGGNSLPAIALVGGLLAISVDDACDRHGPLVELWSVD